MISCKPPFCFFLFLASSNVAALFGFFFQMRQLFCLSRARLYSVTSEFYEHTHTHMYKTDYHSTPFSLPYGHYHIKPRMQSSLLPLFLKAFNDSSYPHLFAPSPPLSLKSANRGKGVRHPRITLSFFFFVVVVVAAVVFFFLLFALNVCVIWAPFFYVWPLSPM